MGDFRAKGKGRNPYHHCFCALSYQSASTFRYLRQVGKNLDHEPPSFLAAFFFFFLVRCRYLPCKALVIPMLPYLTELRLAWLPSFLFSLWNICCSSSRDALCCLCSLSQVSCTSSWASAMSVLHCLSIGVFLIELLPPFPDGLSVNYSFSLSLSHFP